MIPSFPCLRRTLSGLVFACACIALSAAPDLDLERLTPVAADQPIPPQDFFRPGLWRQPQMNPSGTHVAALMHRDDDRWMLLIHDLETQTSNFVGYRGSKEIYDFRWLNDRRLIFFVSSEKLYGLGMFGVDVDATQKVFPILQYCGASLVSVPRSDPLRPLVWLRQDQLENQGDCGVAVINTDFKEGLSVDLTGADASYNDALDVRDSNRKGIVTFLPAPKSGMVYGYLADREGRLAFAFTSKDGVNALHRLDGEKQWLPSPIDLETTRILGPGDIPGQVIARTQDSDQSPSTIRFINAETGERSEVLIADKEYDFVGSIYRESDSREIIGVNYQRDGPRTVWFHESFRIVQKAIEGFFPGQVVRILDNSEKGARFLVSTYSDRHPLAFHWIDLEKRSGKPLKSTRPWIDPARMRPMQIMKFQTRDGRKLDAYVTLPKGASRKTPAPLVVLPHGGPWVRDTWGFDGEAQFLASRGYAVLQPNYRGSPGYDWMFPIEDQWEFRKMHDDVTDATRTLLATGAIDASRVAIMGGSFGAYLALSGVAHEPELYRCAVTIAGVFDWATVLKEDKRSRFDDPSYGLMLKKLGDPRKHAEKYDAISPLRHVSNVRVPVFVAHGKEDQVASVGESKRLVAELQKYKVPHEKFFVAGEGHGMAYVKNDVDLYTRIERFLAEHLAAAPVAATEPPK